MDKYIFDESNGLWYELQGDYYIPCLILSEEETQPIGLWGQRHKQYPRHQNSLFRYWYLALPHFSNIIKLLLPFRYPMKLDTAILGGISTNICI